jgi:hypothetical protein
LVAIHIAYRIIKFSIFESIIKPLLGTLIMGIVTIFVKNLLPVNLISVFILVILGLFVYTGTMYLMVGTSIYTDAKKIIREILPS